jgi:Zn2+/Cd2+-exporting ATPase
MSKECCSHEPKKTNSQISHSQNPHGNENHDHSHNFAHKTRLQLFFPSIISFILLMTGISFDYWLKPDWFSGLIRFVFYLVAYIPVGFPVMKEALHSFRYSDFFSEFLLMSIATIGAFAIGEYPEGVAVMLFYSVGEIFQTLAVEKAQKNIKNLLDQRPDEVTILENEIPKTIKAEQAEIGQIIQMKAGEKLALDGELISESASFNTAALTGESKPDTKRNGDTVLAGMINLNTVSLVKINTKFQDSKLSKILELVQNATSQKAKTELFIRKFAKIYTPIVVFLAIAITLLPYFFVENYIFRDWLYRALIFLVISCPCALVISIPLGYFGGIGAGSKNGILFKGSNFLDILANVQHVVMDKTGTMTEGVFKVQEINFVDGINKEAMMKYLNLLESKSTHPIASAIHEFAGEIDHSISIENVEEIAGHGLKGTIQGKELLAGNFKLMEKFGVQHNVNNQNVSDTLIAVAYDRRFLGYLTISDQIKEDAAQTISLLKNMNVKTTMLSGDKTAVVEEVAKNLGITNYFGDLLPEDKVNKLKAIKSKNESVAFIGDGVNDAPVVALSDVGIAMDFCEFLKFKSQIIFTS